MRGTGVRLAQAGYAVYGMDYEGHGKSDGLRGYVPSFDAKRDEIRRNPYCYKGRPRLKTAHELLRASLRVESEVLTQVTLPFLVVHGGGDRVTDPSVSQLLCREAPSTDKTLKLYPGMWHALTSGELPENIDKVFFDIIAWLDHRSGPPAPERDD
ncbi:unnamed protein product [Triticum turgidum subsp. durum]|uniref:Serine aminopeptidase S33 domain-containing protein n=1 Tax=Triticum turgidum subsp. durum TaxID=4567 RepID=A0A9R0SCL8_TRITD|nr:unnamed protein product [Triticum turgidum subsp. durum]